MGHLYNTESNLMHFVHNPNFLLVFWKDIAKPNQKQLEVLKNITFWWSYAGNKYLPPEDSIYLYVIEWVDVRKYDAIKRQT